ncbi:effector-associated domain 2-containing protein [Actinophytocola sp.]|uniref:VMAP-C domain-containing protein n=1 Tax=Actinophytocola sp. TaxID=1872138 RepID=UPI002ED1E9E4
MNLLIDRLEQIPSLRDPASRRLCLDLLVDRLGVRLVVEDLPTTRAHLIGIVQACRRQHPRAVYAFLDAVEQLEPGSTPVQRARAAVDDMTALELVGENDRSELLTLLGGGPDDRLGEFVRSAAGPAAALIAEERYPADALATLERMNARPDGIPPLLVFVELLAAYFGGERADRLRQWNDRQAERVGLIEGLHAVRHEAITESPPQEVVAYLVVRVEADLLDADQLTVTHWRQNHPTEWCPRRGEPFSGDLDAVRAHVAELVAEAESGWARKAVTIQIEFLLPYDLLNLPVDQWDLEAGSGLPRPLGLHYQVVIRSLDRARSPQWHREWRRRWENLKATSGLQGCEEQWLWSEGTKPRQLGALDAKLAVRKDVVSLVLRAAPDGGKPGEVIVGVRTGVPVMIWHRSDSGRAAFETEVKAMMRDALPDLAENLRLLRSDARQAPRPGSHVGSRVSLLWDDPERPVEPPEPPAAPLEEVPAS